MNGLAGLREGNPYLTICVPADITHPIPDLTGYITEGQVYVDRQLHNRQVTIKNSFLIITVFYKHLSASPG